MNSDSKTSDPALVSEVPHQKPVASETSTQSPKEPSRSLRLVAAIASTWLRTVLTVGIGLVATPLLVRYLGADRFGIIRGAEQWFAYVEFFSFGLGSALSVLLIRAATSGNIAELPGTVWGGVRILARQFRWTIPTFMVLYFSFPFVVELPQEYHQEYIWALPALIVGMLIVPFGVFRSVLDSKQQGYWTNVGLILQAVIVAAAGVSFAYSGFGLVGQFWAITLGGMAFAAFCFVRAGGWSPEFRSAPATALPTGEVWQLQWPLMLTGISIQINAVSDNLLAGIVLGIEEVAALALTQRLPQVAMVAGASFSSNGIWVGLIDLRAKVGEAAYADRLAETAKLTVGAMLLVLAPVVACNRRFVELWVGEAVYAGDWTTLLTALQLVVFNFFLLFAALIDCLGLTRRRVWMSMVGTALKLALIVPFTSWLGVAGLPLATTVGLLCTDVWFGPWILKHETGISLRRVARGVGRSLLIGGAWMAACLALATRSAFIYPGWLGLFAEVAVLGSVSLTVGWLLVLSRSERTMWRSRVRNWFTRSK